MAEHFNKLWQEKHDRFMKRNKCNFSITSLTKLSLMWLIQRMIHILLLLSVHSVIGQWPFLLWHRFRPIFVPFENPLCRSPQTMCVFVCKRSRISPYLSLSLSFSHCYFSLLFFFFVINLPSSVVWFDEFFYPKLVGYTRKSTDLYRHYTHRWIEFQSVTHSRFNHCVDLQN